MLDSALFDLGDDFGADPRSPALNAAVNAAVAASTAASKAAHTPAGLVPLAARRGPLTPIERISTAISNTPGIIVAAYGLPAIPSVIIVGAAKLLGASWLAAIGLGAFALPIAAWAATIPRK